MGTGLLFIIVMNVAGWLSPLSTNWKKSPQQQPQKDEIINVIACIHTISLSLSLTHTHFYKHTSTHILYFFLSLSVCLSLSHTHTYACTRKLSFTHTHAYNISFSLSLSLTHTHTQTHTDALEEKKTNILAKLKFWRKRKWKIWMIKIYI